MPDSNARVIATYSRRMALRLAGGDEVMARIKGKKLRPVCGDRVIASAIAGEPDWLITDIHERSNALTRPNLRGQVEILAANVELLVAVAAVTPVADWFVVDRYLSAAEDMGIDAVVVFNKIDLGITCDLESVLADYERIDYPVVRCSAASDTGIDGLQAAIAGRVAIIVGQSGTGKSSIINRLLGGDSQKTAAISAKSREGRHTTVNSVMLELPDGGRVIDSPGVRDYAPALESPHQAINGFREIARAGPQCRFANCRHLREPDCAVKRGVETGAISARRYESYKRLLRMTETDNR